MRREEARPKVIFLHGFFASGACAPASALREALSGEADVLSPDLPLRPLAALDFVRSIIEAERPDLIVGNSNGSFLAQIVAKDGSVPALLGNPHFAMTRFLTERVGPHEYKSARADGNQHFVIDQPLIDEFAGLQAVQFEGVSASARERVWGIFGEQDNIAHYEPLFLEHYLTSRHFPGGHTPTAEETKDWYAPLVRQMLGIFGR